MADLENVIRKCVCEVTLTVKQHHSYAQSITDYLAQLSQLGELNGELSGRIIELGYVYELQFYPDTPTHFYCVFGTSVDECVRKALEIFAEKYPGR